MYPQPSTVARCGTQHVWSKRAHPKCGTKNPHSERTDLSSFNEPTVQTIPYAHCRAYSVVFCYVAEFFSAQRWDVLNYVPAGHNYWYCPRFQKTLLCTFRILCASTHRTLKIKRRHDLANNKRDLSRTYWEPTRYLQVPQPSDWICYPGTVLHPSTHAI